VRAARSIIRVSDECRDAHAGLRVASDKRHCDRNSVRVYKNFIKSVISRRFLKIASGEY
jgi:hypothetical protein